MLKLSASNNLANVCFYATLHLKMFVPIFDGSEWLHVIFRLVIQQSASFVILCHWHTYRAVCFRLESIMLMELQAI